MLTLAIIPARGGSKGVPRKNLRFVGGLSLLQRAIDGARKSGMIDHVLVSTDDEEIQKEAARAGAEVPFLRPAALADDQTASADVVAHAVEQFERLAGARPDTIVLLEPTSPFRNAESIRRALLKYAEGTCRSVVSVCPLERKPENIFIKGPTLEPYIRQPRERFARRQDMHHLCRLNSAIYVVNRDAFMQEKRFLLEPIGYVEMTPLESINIDEELDLEFAELVAKEYGL